MGGTCSDGVNCLPNQGPYPADPHIACGNDFCCVPAENCGFGGTCYPASDAGCGAYDLLLVGNGACEGNQLCCTWPQ